MKPETKVYLVAALDQMITHIDNALDEIAEADAPEIQKAEVILMHVTMELNGLIDRLTEEGLPKGGADV